MELLVGAYETEFINNTVQIPKVWRSRVKTHTAYCTLEAYESEGGEMLTKIRATFERDDFMFGEVRDDAVFTMGIDRKKRIHVPQKYMDICNFESNGNILLVGWGRGFHLQTKPRKITQEEIEQIKQIIHEGEDKQTS